jgi:hypothetical protein
MALVSVTRLRLRSNRYLLPFMFDAISSSWQAKRAPGHLRSTTRRTENTTFWTLSVWESEADMRSYIRSGPHRKAMPKLQQWCDEASVVHWEQDGTKLPRWEEAEQMMRDRGRFTPLTHPSSAHLTKTLSV